MYPYPAGKTREMFMKKNAKKNSVTEADTLVRNLRTAKKIVISVCLVPSFVSSADDVLTLRSHLRRFAVGFVTGFNLLDNS